MLLHLLNQFALNCKIFYVSLYIVIFFPETMMHSAGIYPLKLKRKSPNWKGLLILAWEKERGQSVPSCLPSSLFAVWGVGDVKWATC